MRHRINTTTERERERERERITCDDQQSDEDDHCETHLDFSVVSFLDTAAG